MISGETEILKHPEYKLIRAPKHQIYILLCNSVILSSKIRLISCQSQAALTQNTNIKVRIKQKTTKAKHMLIWILPFRLLRNL